jgi:regulator of sirC expression with transglutaminase-like and TPR domain
MEYSNEISALFQLMDDPDEDIYGTVQNRLLSFGKDIIPNLELFSETMPSPIVQERISILLKRLYFDGFLNDWQKWLTDPSPDLLDGALILSRFIEPDLNTEACTYQVEKIRRSIWLELNSYLTAMEQINIVNKILFLHYQWEAGRTVYARTEEFSIGRVLPSRKGNAISNGILYQYLCQMLDIPVWIIPLPGQVVLAYLDQSTLSLQTGAASDNAVMFFIDPVTGHMYSRSDIEQYLKRINTPLSAEFTRPASSKEIMMLMIDELIRSYENRDITDKVMDLHRLKNILLS